jgi:hypothetical protein
MALCCSGRFSVTVTTCPSSDRVRRRWRNTRLL